MSLIVDYALNALHVALNAYFSFMKHLK